MDTQTLLVGTMNKIAQRKQAEIPKKELPVKTASALERAEKVAETLDYLGANFELAFGSPLQRAIKLAGDLDIPNVLPNAQSTGPDGKKINETRDAMATGEEPTADKGKGKESFEGVPNTVPTTASHRPGGAPVNPDAVPLNKTALSKVLAKLARDKTAGDLDIPNTLKIMESTESGKGQAGGEPGAGSENRHLVATSNAEAMNYTKGDAKKNYNKSQMSQVFDEVHPEKDKALDRAFSHGVDTAKLAGVMGNVGNAVRGAGADLLGNAAGLASKAHEMGGKAVGAVGDALSSPMAKGMALAGGSSGAAGLGTLAGNSIAGLDENNPNVNELAGQGVGSALGGGFGGMSGVAMAMRGNPKVGIPLAALGALGGSYLGNQAGGAIGRATGEKQAAACECKGKGCEKCRMKKAAAILRKLAEGEVPTNMPPGAPDPMAQAAIPPEQVQGMGGQEDQIEKLKKLLLLMQMAKKQEETQMMQGQGATPDMGSPGAGSAADMTASAAGPQGAM